MYGRTATYRLFSPSSIARLRNGCTPTPPRKGWSRAPSTSRPWGSDSDEAGLVALGSGEAQPCAFRDTLGVRDVLLLVSDGAWTPLGTAGLERAVRSMTTRAFTDVPAAVLDQASRRGRADDMAVVALRLLRA